MKKSIVCFFVACAAARCCGGQGIVASLRIDDQSFCEGMPGSSFYPVGHELGGDAISLDLGLTLAYRNLGPAPVILQTLHDVLVVLSRSPADAANRRNQTEFPAWDWGRGVRWTPADLDGFLDIRRPSGNFVAIQFNDAYTERFRMSFQVHKPSAAGTGRELLGKTVYLQLDLDHRYLPENIESYVRERLKPYGALWAGETRTQPIEINIPKVSRTSHCVSNYHLD